MNTLPFKSNLVLPVLLSLLAGIFLRLVFSFATPIGGPSIAKQLSSYNDEIAHSNYVLTFIETGHLPKNIEPIDNNGALERGQYENYQPPLYYCTLASIGKVFNLQTLDQITLLGRLFGLVVFAGLIYIYRLFMSFFREDNAIFLTGLILLSLSGVLVRFTSTVGNDPLFWFFAGGMILASLHIWRDELSFKWLALFTVFTILGIYTKLTSVILLPLLLIAVSKGKHRNKWSWSSLAYIVIFVSTLPIWYRNITQFGALLPLSTGFGNPEFRIPGFYLLFFAFRSIIFPWSEFWHGFTGLIVLIVPALTLLYFSLKAKNTRYLKNPILISAGLLAFLSFLWLNLQYDQAEGRYLLSAWPLGCLIFSFVPSKPMLLWILLISLLFPYLLFLFPLFGV